MEELLSRLKKAVRENEDATSDAQQALSQFVPRMVLARPSKWKSAPSEEREKR
jgi:hypothetical protein